MVRSTTWLTGFCVAALASAAVGCGGGTKTGAGKGTTPAGPRGAPGGGGGGLRTAAGVPINVTAQAAWTKARQSFDKYEKQGWNNAACQQVAGEFEDASSEIDGGFAEAIFMSGLAWSRCGEDQKAMAYYQKAHQKNPKYCKARVAVLVPQLRDGGSSAEYKELQDAIRDDSQCTEAYVNLAVLQQARGGNQVKEALNNLRRALAVDSRYLPAFNQMALLYLEQSKTRPELLQLAEVVSKQAQLVNADYAPIYNTWGLVNVRKGDIIEATRLFERAMTLDPEFFEAHVNFGQVTLSFRGFSDAKRALTKAVQLRPRHYEARLALGKALRGLRDYKGALAQYKKALDIDSRRPEAYYNLGILYQNYLSGSVSDLQTAKKYYQAFVNRTRGSQYKEEVQEVKSVCRTSKKRRRAGKPCRPGRLQNIDTAIAALSAAKS